MKTILAVVAAACLAGCSLLTLSHRDTVLLHDAADLQIANMNFVRYCETEASPLRMFSIADDMMLRAMLLQRYTKAAAPDVSPLADKLVKNYEEMKARYSSANASTAYCKLKLSNTHELLDMIMDVEAKKPR